MLIDTHCHLDAPSFDSDRQQVLARALSSGVGAVVVPSVSPANFVAVRALAERHPQVMYALGVHPLFTQQLPADWLAQLHCALQECHQDPQLVAIGEIGLDYFVPGYDAPLQESVYRAQLELAVQFHLPVLLHVRRSQDRLLKHLRQAHVSGGIAHAFNGSCQQAEQFIEQGFALGFGGAMTFDRARQIRRLAKELPDTVHVLETDSPDMAPEWINRQRNEPGQLPRIAESFAAIRQRTELQVIQATANNARRVLPRLASWLDRENASG